ncbi:MAG: hypothetical protein KKB50_03120 [Planctomycetes bacterium]|nr:hypothetical protein [Planctomycetota bacterium]
MLATTRMGRLLVGLVVTFGLAAPAALADSPQHKLYQAYYLEHEQGDLRAAAELYGQVATDREAQTQLRKEAKARLAGCQEELATADFARLMPPNALAYIELNRPGDQLLRLVKQLGLLADGKPPTAGEKRVVISPAVIKELLGIRGAAVAITGFDPTQEKPTGVLVFHPGNLEVIRGLIETGLPAAGQPVTPIDGFPTYDIEGEALVTLTKRLVIVSQQRGEIEDVIGRLKGDVDGSLLDNPQMAEVLQGRDDSLVYFCVNAKPIMPLLNAALAAGGTQCREVAMAQALLDLKSLHSLSGRAGISDEALFLDVTLRLNEGHRNLVYNFLRMPPIDARALKCIPAGAASFFAASLSDPAAQYRAAPADNTDAIPVVTGMDFLRELFANIVSVAVYALPPDGSPRPAGPPIPDVAAVITVHDPEKSQALWGQMLGIASLATGAGALEPTTVEIAGVPVQRYNMPDGVSVYFTMVENDMLVTPSKSAMKRSLAARRGEQSILEDPSYAHSVARLGPGSTMALVVHAGRCAEIAKQFMPADEIKEMEAFLPSLSDTVASLVIEHSGEMLRLSGTVAGIPDVGDVVAKLINEQARYATQHATVIKAVNNEQWDEAQRAVKAGLESEPDNIELLKTQFHILAIAKGDREAARACGEQILQKVHDDATSLNNFAWALLTEDEYGSEYDELALRMSARSNKLTNHKNWMFVDTLALAKFKTGDAAAAVELEQAALRLCDDQEGAKEVKKALARFEAALVDAEL